MAYIYDRSKEFEGKAHFFFGSVLSTPFCIGVLNMITNDFKPNLSQILFACMLLIAGLLYIANSYIIMQERDINNARFYSKRNG